MTGVKPKYIIKRGAISQIIWVLTMIVIVLIGGAFAFYLLTKNKKQVSGKELVGKVALVSESGTFQNMRDLGYQVVTPLKLSDIKTNRLVITDGFILPDKIRDAVGGVDYVIEFIPLDELNKVQGAYPDIVQGTDSTNPANGDNINASDFVAKDVKTYLAGMVQGSFNLTKKVYCVGSNTDKQHCQVYTLGDGIYFIPYNTSKFVKDNMSEFINIVVRDIENSK